MVDFVYSYTLFPDDLIQTYQTSDRYANALFSWLKNQNIAYEIKKEAYRYNFVLTHEIVAGYMLMVSLNDTDAVFTKLHFVHLVTREEFMQADYQFDLSKYVKIPEFE